MHKYTLKVSERDAGKRLDLFLLDFFHKKKSGFSRTFIQKLIRGGNVLSNGGNLKPHHKIKPEEEIEISPVGDKAPLFTASCGVYIADKKHQALIPEEIPLEIIYEDNALAVINKPAGLVVHPGAGNPAHTLVNALLYHFKELSEVNPARPGIVHRLDKDTSGLLVIAKNNFAYHSLVKQFAQHSVQRKYIALVKGRMEYDENIIELPIGRHPRKRESMSVGFGKKTRYAKTYYRTLKRSADFSLVELRPFTGRTHQLRVHLAFLGHPILGDKKYGKNNSFPRLALHAQELGFLHPFKEKFVKFSSPMPPEFSVNNYVIMPCLLNKTK